MFANLTHWQWVGIAWGELVVVYATYLVYMAWRARQAKRGGNG